MAGKSDLGGGLRLRRWRERQGLSQDALSVQVGCSRTMIAWLESSGRAPGLEIAFAIERLGGPKARSWAAARA